MTIPLGREICLRSIVDSTISFIHVELKSPRFTHTCEDEASNSYIGANGNFIFVFGFEVCVSVTHKIGGAIVQIWCVPLATARTCVLPTLVSYAYIILIYFQLDIFIVFLSKKYLSLNNTHSVLLPYISFLYFYLF